MGGGCVLELSRVIESCNFFKSKPHDESYKHTTHVPVLIQILVSILSQCLEKAQVLDGIQNYRIVVEVLLQLQRLLRWPLHRTSRQTRTSCGETNTMLRAGNLYTLFDMKEIRWIYCSKKTTEPVLLAS